MAIIISKFRIISIPRRKSEGNKQEINWKALISENIKQQHWPYHGEGFLQQKKNT
jgi:hypothetical protein